MTAQSSTATPATADSASEPDRFPWHGLGLALLAVALSFGWFLLDGDTGINLADEGYLWYGAQAVARGEVPMRDFQAYDPGRYLWVAAWGRVLGQDLAALRFSCVIFQCLGVTAGLLVAWRLSRHWLFLLAVALLLCTWMHPRFKCFEQSIALIAVYAGVLLLERPTPKRHFVAGIFTGLMAVFGRNHGMYLVLAFALLLILAARGGSLVAGSKGWIAWVAGIFIGYMPQLLMLKLVPGYRPEFERYLLAILAKGTNLASAVPWPWRVDMSLPNWRWAAALLEGCFFIALPLFLAVALVRVFRSGLAPMSGQRVLAAATCVTLPYAHFAFSRPDTIHLGHAAPTLALGLIALAFASAETQPWLWKIVTLVLLCASALTNLFETGLALRIFPPPLGLVPMEVRGRAMRIGPEDAQLLRCATKLSTEIANDHERILFLPNLAGLYPAMGLRSPIRQLYCIFPASLAEESTMIREIDEGRTQWVMLRDYAIDGRDELRFRQAHPITQAHFQRYFAPFRMEELPPDTVILRRKTRQRP